MKSVAALEKFGRHRLSQHFFMRDFLYSEISQISGIPNIPENPKLCLQAGAALCENLLEPLRQSFGHVSIRSAYRSPAVNAYGNAHNYNCSNNEKNRAHHIWDRLDKDGNMGATACIVLPAVIPYYKRTGHWEAIAWYIHDYFDYHYMEFFPKLAAFNINWRQNPQRTIYSYTPPTRGYLTRPGMGNFTGDHKGEYAQLLAEIGPSA